ncbi:predicted protein [Uncinocarpus reesii 1704]|uniref:Leucine Rich Repeat domain protein n=1 Tax=Uncinocarpus reesii (strain UAMH 1704) TaxID=336963 RepID=C4JSU3_UNCRE|nr:uncharacterized protein UREG_05532 [Uncinocarpus reesii 1704]EEP80690.1 predicted protein [Uncinocarpus reesii 1704]
MDPDLPSPPVARSQRTVASLARVSVPNASLPFAQRPVGLNLDALSGPPSSDPPLFSSDDFQPGLEDYTPKSSSGARRGAEHDGGENKTVRKRRYRGTWWGEKLPIKKKRTRTEFKKKRDLDSGVWMMSGDDSSGLLSSDVVDAADDSEMVGGSRASEEKSFESPAIWGLPQASIGLHSEGVMRKPVKADRAMETEAQRHARSAVYRCLEEGNDNVDLSYFNLETIPPGILQPLIQLTKEPTLEKPPLSEDVYGPLEPFLRLYLPQNRLTFLPKEIFDLEELKVLSLRQNELSEVPCAIRKLIKLQDLNLAVNRLTYLPWEILGLMQTGDLKRLTVHPNPFVSLNETEIAQWHWDVEEGTTPISERLKQSHDAGDDNPQAWLPLHIATGRITYFDQEGRPLPHSDRPLTRTFAQSLRELSLQACLRSPQMSHLLDHTADDGTDDQGLDCPSFVARLLDFARLVKRTGDRACSVCGRTYVIPRVEWVEWWDCSPYENGSKIGRVNGQRLWPLPFVRRGCSWGCGMAAVEGKVSD